MKYDDFKLVSEDDFPLLKKYFVKYPLYISEYSIANLCIWQDYYQFRWFEINENLFIMTTNDSSKMILFPPLGSTWTKYFDDLLKMAQKINKKLEFHRIPESYLPDFANHHYDFVVIDDRNNWDYIHNRTDLVNLAGKPFANLRKKINKFKRSYNWEYREITPLIVEDLVKLQHLWCEYQSCLDDLSLIQENEGIIKILKHWEELDLLGGAIYINKIPIAYTIAEIISPTKVIIHIEKASREYIGAYQVIASEFAQHLNKQFKLLNREQDLGDVGLRRSRGGLSSQLLFKKVSNSFLDSNDFL